MGSSSERKCGPLFSTNVMACFGSPFCSGFDLLWLREEPRKCNKGRRTISIAVELEQYKDVYVAADSGLRKATNEQDLATLFQAVHKKLGNVRHSS